MPLIRHYPPILQLEVQLQGAIIPIWRLIEVNRNFTLHQLHACIQLAMGWKCAHLYQFSFGDVHYIDMTMDEPVGNRQHDDSRKTHIYDLIDTPGDRLEYVYDYGDNWIHSIELKGMTKHPQSFLGKSPGVLAGSMACPPEDCGGINAYNEFLAWKLFKTPPQYHSEITEYLKDHDIWNPELRGLAFMDSSVKRLLREIDKD